MIDFAPVSGAARALIHSWGPDYCSSWSPHVGLLLQLRRRPCDMYVRTWMRPTKFVDTKEWRPAGEVDADNIWAACEFAEPQVQEVTKASPWVETSLGYRLAPDISDELDCELHTWSRRAEWRWWAVASQRLREYHGL